MKKTLLPILLASAWISISEFLRNSIFLHSHWVEHYQNLGLIFPESPINGITWGIWSICFACVIFILSKKYTLLQTTLISWFIGFALMWIVLANLSVLPFAILPLAIPLILLEAFVASYCMYKFK